MTNPNRNYTPAIAPTAPAPVPKKLEKVIQGGLVVRKKSWLESLGETFFGDDSDSVGTYILWDVLIPAAKNTLAEMVSGGIEMLLFGDTKGHRNVTRDKGRSRIQYGSYYGDRNEVDRGPGRPREIDRRSSQKFTDIVMRSRVDAEEVLSSLAEVIETYEQVSVAEFYDLVGMESSFADNKYGWTNLSRASVERVRDGYILDLPRPVVLD